MKCSVIGTVRSAATNGSGSYWLCPRIVASPGWVAVWKSARVIWPLQSGGAYCSSGVNSAV